MMQTALIALGAVLVLRFVQEYADGIVGIATFPGADPIFWHEILPVMMGLAVLILAWN